MDEHDMSDVIIMGGGLAGLCLALQLHARDAGLRITVIERNQHPLPHAAHKVGESTVEIGAHYFADVLGLRDHLESCHIRKFGFRFFFSEGRERIDQSTETGLRERLPTVSWQIDRGIFENHLGELVRQRGIDLRTGASIRSLTLGAAQEPHSISVEQDGNTQHLQARWLIDASGRSALLKRKLGLERGNDHAVNAAWFRINDRLAIDDWDDNADWRAQVSPPERWRSTNHLCGAGYWVWLIPLSSGAHSVGIVADPALHPLEQFNTFERALDWLQRFQPALARQVAQRRDKLMDFRFLRRFSHRCKQVFSADRWAITGDAGVFLDPFYSPGSDYIGIGNGYITELILRDRAGTPFASHAALYQQLFFSFYESTLALYQDQYPLFGDARIMSLKVTWDYTFYWGVLCQLVFQGHLNDVAFLGALRPELDRANALNRRMQEFFRTWLAAGEHASPAQMLDQGSLNWFYSLNGRLHVPLDRQQSDAQIRANIALMHGLAAAIAGQAKVDRPHLDISDLPVAEAPLPELFTVA